MHLVHEYFVQIQMSEISMSELNFICVQQQFGVLHNARENIDCISLTTINFTTEHEIIRQLLRMINFKFITC